MPETAIVLIQDTLAGVTVSASGFLISPDEVLTASHILYDSGSRTTATNITVTPDPSTTGSPYGTYAGSTLPHYNAIADANDSINNNAAGVGMDFGLIHLTQPVASGVEYFGLEQDYDGGSATLYGFPGGNPPESSIATTLSLNTPTIAYNLFTLPPVGLKGYSGGPYVIQDSSGVYGAVGSQSATDFLAGTTTPNPNGNSYAAAFTAGAVAEIEFWEAQDGESPAIQRLYVGVFGHLGDTAGLKYWSASFINEATTLSTPSQNVYASSATVFANYSDLPQDFLTVHGAISNSDLVTQLYYNEFGHAPDQAGYNYWMNDLNTGSLTQAQLVGIFSSVPEAISHLGYWGQTTQT